jgi:F1F0 ATPase subunit 2
MSAEATLVVLAFTAGALLGTVYFGGLWLTARRLAHSRRPAMLAVGSYVVRLFVAGLVLTWAARQGLAPALSALAGFLVVRAAAVRRAGAPPRSAES